MLNPKRLITAKEAWAAIYWQFEIGHAALAGRLKTQRVAQARAILFWLLYRGTHMGMVEVGQILGRCHTTVLNAIRRVDSSVEQLALAMALEQWIIEQRKAVSA